MTATSWLAGNTSLEVAHHKYGRGFEAAYREFKNFAGASDTDLSARAALWVDQENRGENVMRWYRERQC